MQTNALMQYCSTLVLSGNGNTKYMPSGGMKEKLANAERKKLKNPAMVRQY
jgi:hypothetical protein